MSCNRAREFFAHNSIDVAETQNARAKLGADDALALARAATIVHVAKGKKIVSFEMADAPSDDELLAVMLGRSGTLRAPTLRRGTTLLVGFNADLYQRL